jgi:hypothetical protein
VADAGEVVQRTVVAGVMRCGRSASAVATPAEPERYQAVLAMNAPGRA